MADKIFDSGFATKAKAAVTRADKVLINGSADSDTTVVTVGDLVDAITGIDTIPTGNIPVKHANGTLTDSDTSIAGLIQDNGTAALGDIPYYLGSGFISSSGFSIRNIASWSASLVKGLFKAIVSINGSTLVGRIGITNSTGSGVSIGLYNDGAEVKAALHPTLSNSVSSTPTWLATEGYVGTAITAALNEVTLYATTTDETSVEFLDANGDRLPAALAYPYMIQIQGVRTGDDNGVLFNGYSQAASASVRSSGEQNTCVESISFGLSDVESQGVWVDVTTIQPKLYAKGDTATNLEWAIICRMFEYPAS
jgi:hypothetical protein